MFKKTLLAAVLLCSGVAFASEKTTNKEEFYLVVGSTRDQNLQKAENVLAVLWDDKNADFSHKKTFDKNATTMDLYASKTNDNHIQGNALTFDFSKKYKIKGVYLERPETFSPSIIGKLALTQNQTKSYLGQMIGNIKKSLKNGATFDIEWHPCVAVTPMNGENVDKGLNSLTQDDPWSGYFSFMTILPALLNASGLECPEEKFSKNNIKMGKEFSESMKKFLYFYVKKGMDTLDNLKERIQLEIPLLSKLITGKESLILSASPRGDLKKFKQALNTSYYVKNENIKSVKLKNGEMVYDFPTLIENTFSCYLLSDITVLYNKDKVLKFMESEGFKDAKLKRTTSPYNGRKNVWIISSTYSK